MDKFLREQGANYHPLCEPKDPNETLAFDILSDLTDIVRWTDNNSARSLQASIGPSELGSSCDRRIAYRIANVAETNDWTDPWKAIVGTSVHAWMEEAVSSFQTAHFMDRWLLETTIHPDPLVVGHCDLFDIQYRMVIDYKTTSKTKLKTWKTQGPPEYYQDQVHLYGKGMEKAGYPVDKVALIAIPRDGQLSEWQMWIDDYKPERAQACLDRMYGIANLLIEQGQQLDFEAIPADPGTGCSYCPWYRGGTAAADSSGCSGNSNAARMKFSEGLIKPITVNDIHDSTE